MVVTRAVGSGSAPLVEDRVFDLGDLQPVVPRQGFDGFTGIDPLHQSAGGDSWSRYGGLAEGDTRIDHHWPVRGGPFGAEGVEAGRKSVVIAFDSLQVGASRSRVATKKRTGEIPNPAAAVLPRGYIALGRVSPQGFDVLQGQAGERGNRCLTRRRPWDFW